MVRVVALALAFSFCLLTAPEAQALGGDHPPGKIAEEHKDWPKGLPDLINSAGRVQGHWVNADDFFYYRGGAGALNKFLAAYGKLPDGPLVVVIHTGKVPLTGPLGEEQKTQYDWQLDICRRGWGAPIDPRRPRNDPGYVVTVHIWLSDALTLDKLTIPKHVEVRSAGDIERFIDSHRAGGK